MAINPLKWRLRRSPMLKQSGEDSQLWPIKRAVAVMVTVGLTLVTLLVIIGWALLGFSGIKRQVDEPISTYFELLKLAFAVVAGIGGTVALVVAYRRQRLAETAHSHTEQVAQDNLKDATERRITDLYTKAVEQIGHDKAAVRLGGLYALERLAQDHPSHRQTVVDVICAYLRMPWTPPLDEATGGTLDKQEPENFNAHTEGQVRLTAQQILWKHLRYKGMESQPPETYWHNMDINLSGAHLTDFTLSHCRVRRAIFSNAVFHGGSIMAETTFLGRAYFVNAIFKGFAGFSKTIFAGETAFSGVRFEGTTFFPAARFSSETYFNDAYFSGEVRFAGGKFRYDIVLKDAKFEGPLYFKNVTARPGSYLRSWPKGWRTESDPNNRDILRLVPLKSTPPVKGTA